MNAAVVLGLDGSACSLDAVAVAALAPILGFVYAV